MNTTSMSFEQFTNTVESIAPYYAILNGIGEPLDKLAASCPTWVRSPSVTVQVVGALARSEGTGAAVR